MTRRLFALAALSVSGVLAQANALRSGDRLEHLSLAPYVPSPQPVVERMLDLAKLKAGETVYDLGCGDGRILFTAADKFGAKAVGIELSASLVRLAEKHAKQLGLADSIRVIHGNLLEADLSGADVVTLYLMTSSNDKVRPLLEKYLKPGSRVVSHDFEIRGWKPAAKEKLVVEHHTHTIYLYEMASAAKK